MTDNATLDTLVTGVAAAVQEGGGEHAVTAAVADVLASALAAGLRLPPGVTKPGTERYLMYPLHVAADRRFSIAAAVWGVGQRTPVHDHGVWGVVGIHSGAERELRYEHTDAGPLRLLGEAQWRPGEVTICCTSDRDLHEVSCAGDIPCVGVHIYGGDIGSIRRRSYDPATGQVSYFVSTWAHPEGS